MALQVMEAHGGEELASTLQLESSEEDSAFRTASEAIEKHNTGVSLPSPTLEARHCSSSSSSSQFLSANSVSTLKSSGSSHPDNKLELEIQTTEVQLQLEPCTSNSKPRSSELEQEIEASKVHWSELSSYSESSDGETNRTIFQKMRQNPVYQDLFRIDFVDVVVGQRIAEGGQAEIFELDYSRTRYENSGGLEWFDLELPCVLKVFKAGYSLHDLQSQWPQGMLKRNYNNAILNSEMEDIQTCDYKRSAVSNASVKTVGHISTSFFSNDGYHHESYSEFTIPDFDEESERVTRGRGQISTSFSSNDGYHHVSHSGFTIPDFDEESKRVNWGRRHTSTLSSSNDGYLHVRYSGFLTIPDADEESERVTWGRVRRIPNSEFRSSIVVGGVVLEDDRFAFVLQREGVDLRKLIDVFQDEKSVEWEPKNRIFGEYLTFHPQRSVRRGTGPVFSRRIAYGIIYQIALGMRELHEFDILHRDLKASNVLISDVQDRPKFKGKTRLIQLKVADYECSVGVVGTGFWRAPEILRQLKDRKHPIRFTREADVYSFAMTCYEVLSGSLPLEEYATHDFDIVLGGMRPSLPEYVPNWLKNLIRSCWHDKPSERPTFEAIVEVIVHELIPFADGDSTELLRLNLY